LSGEYVGYIGALHPSIAKSLGVPSNSFVFEIELSRVLSRKLPAYVPISKFPQVNRDLAFVIGREIPSASIEKCIKTEAGEVLKQLKVFDIYSGEGIDSERKSVAFNLTFQDSSRTLNEDEINDKIAAIIKVLEVEFDARLR
jgi:phenylalanyl-tRNA synthetase beta chain